MSFIKQIFGKTIDEFLLRDLESYFESPQEETGLLEFKSGDVEINDLYKEIAAFLNTEGGLIIVGAPQEKKEKIGKLTRIICDGELTFSKFRSKDWLYQKIMSNIFPPPSAIKIFEHMDARGSVFVLDIPQSVTPPHQCGSDGRYYIRLEREAKPAPHGIVQALFQKRSLPQLIADINISTKDVRSDQVVLSLKNNSKIPADKVGILIDVYRVSDVDCEFRFSELPDVLGKKFSLNKSTDQVLVQVVSIPFRFTVYHESKEYIIFVGYWSKDTDFDFQYWTYDPINKRIVCADKMEYENTSFIEEIERLK